MPTDAGPFHPSAQTERLARAEAALLRLYKSRFTAGVQCHKLLWWKTHEPLAPELQPDKVLLDRFDQGKQVGELARQRDAVGIVALMVSSNALEMRSGRLRIMSHGSTLSATSSRGVAAGVSGDEAVAGLLGGDPPALDATKASSDVCAASWTSVSSRIPSAS